MKQTIVMALIALMMCTGATAQDTKAKTKTKKSITGQDSTSRSVPPKMNPNDTAARRMMTTPTPVTPRPAGINPDSSRR